MDNFQTKSQSFPDEELSEDELDEVTGGLLSPGVDVCKTSTAPTPVPIPYPNIAIEKKEPK